jgi:hypothetical protein
MINEDFVYSRIGMALISTQRVEFITGKLLENLIEFDPQIYRITTSEFLERSAKSANAIKTLGSIFKLLKLNPKLVIEEELDNYLKKRNMFVHNFWETYLNTKSEEQAKKAVEFCYDFGRHSDRITSFFKGFLYFLATRFVKEQDLIKDEIREWKSDYNYFLVSLDERNIKDNIKDK